MEIESPSSNTRGRLGISATATNEGSGALGAGAAAGSAPWTIEIKKDAITTTRENLMGLGIFVRKCRPKVEWQSAGRAFSPVTVGGKCASANQTVRKASQS